MRFWTLTVLISGLLISFCAQSAADFPATKSDKTAARIYSAKGEVLEVRPDSRTVVIRHGAIANLMPAMTMPFNVSGPSALAGVRPGDEISFQLHVTATSSWVDQIKKIGTGAPVAAPAAKDTGASSLHYESAATLNTRTANPLLNYKFTNELGQAVSLNDFRGQALAVTFFYTRCPLPDYCPRLSKNFEEASQKLAALTNAPANWHFISITFDPANDTPAMLRAYGESYHYDPKHWSFLTGPPEKIGELARACGVSYEADGGTIKHNFRTLIVNAAGHLQMVFPMTGDLSDQIVAQIIEAAAVTNRTIVSR
jgi:protein SCO1